MDYKNSKAPTNTITINRDSIEKNTDNIYESIMVIAKRANQINGEIKTDLVEKLDAFASHNEGLEEIFENREQIEVSKFYEKLPKSTSMAVQEWLDNNIYHKRPNQESKEDQDVGSAE